MNDSAASVTELIEEVRGKFPPALRADVAAMIEKDQLHVELAFVKGGHVVDLGGGYAPVSAVLAKLGCKVSVVDTFASTKFYEQFPRETLLGVLRSYGVDLVETDLLQFDAAAHFGPESLDCVTCYEAIYFFHPKILLERAVRALKPGGKLVLNFLNAVSLMRRLKVLMGRTNFNSLSEYYDAHVHHRHYVVRELAELAARHGLVVECVFGRNWSFYQQYKGLPLPVLRLMDYALRLVPALSQSIYLVARKPGA